MNPTFPPFIPAPPQERFGCVKALWARPEPGEMRLVAQTLAKREGATVFALRPAGDFLNRASDRVMILLTGDDAVADPKSLAKRVAQAVQELSKPKLEVIA